MRQVMWLRRKQTALIKFKPFSLKQKILLEWWLKESPYCDKDGIIADGSIRSGKTVIMSLSFVIWAMDSFDNENFAMCGKTIQSLRRNVIKSLVKMLLMRGYGVEEHRSENFITVTRGDTINDFYLFGGKDESSQDLIQGLTLAGLYCDEVALMPESFVNQATARCSVEGSKLWFNCNPSSPAHWFKVNWVDKITEKNLIRVHFLMEDNPSLSKKIIERYKANYVGVFYERFILGLWVMAQGMIYAMYQDALIDTLPNTEPTARCISIDYGTMNAFAAILWEKIGDVWYATREYYYSGRETGIQKTDQEYAEDLEAWIADIWQELKETYGGARKIETIIDPSAASFIALLRKTEWSKVRPADNAVMDGIRDTAVALQTGKIKILRLAMPNWIKEAGGYVWDDSEGEERPLKIDDHLMDSMRYFCKTKRISARHRQYPE
jgi:PBSX family phage terminase large subunit